MLIVIFPKSICSFYRKGNHF